MVTMFWFSMFPLAISSPLPSSWLSYWSVWNHQYPELAQLASLFCNPKTSVNSISPSFLAFQMSHIHWLPWSNVATLSSITQICWTSVSVTQDLLQQELRWHKVIVAIDSGFSDGAKRRTAKEMALQALGIDSENHFVRWWELITPGSTLSQLF